MSPPVLEVGDLTVAAGEIVAVLGGNGAGKTALLETILGFRPATGPIVLFGQDVSSLPVERRVRAGCRLCARAPACLRRPHGARESRSVVVAARRRAPPPGGGDAGAVPDAGRAAGGAGLAAVGRPAADAGARPRAHGPAAPAAARRADARAWRRWSWPTCCCGSAPWRPTAPRSCWPSSVPDWRLAWRSRGVVLSRGQIVRAGAAAELAADPRLADLMAGG